MDMKDYLILHLHKINELRFYCDSATIDIRGNVLDNDLNSISKINLGP